MIKKHILDSLIVKAYNAAYSVGYYNAKEDHERGTKYWFQWIEARKNIVKAFQVNDTSDPPTKPEAKKEPAGE